MGHIIGNFRLNDFGIDLRGLQVGMSQHPRYRSDRHVVGRRHGGSKCVPGHVHGEPLSDPGKVGNLLEVGV